jgi:hypothetical protein
MKLFSILFWLAVSIFALPKTRRAENTPVKQPSPREKQDKAAANKPAEMDLHQAVPADNVTPEENWQKEQRENWRKQLLPQWVLALTALLAGVVSFVTLIILNRTVELSRQQLYISQRPWIALNGPIIINSPFTYDDEGAVMDIKLVLKNSGNSVATAVVPMVNAVFGWADEIKRFRDIQISLCSVPGLEKIGYILLPGQEITTSILRQKIPRSYMKPAEQQMWMIGCIRYVDQFDVKHETLFQHMFLPRFKPGVTNGIFHPYIMGNSAN